VFGVSCPGFAYLRLCGYAVVEVTKAAEAVEVIGRGESGRMWYSAMFRCPARSMLTSGHGEAVCCAAIELVGSDCFVAKPYRQEEAAHRIDALLGNDRGAAH
jgi:hypothetical protein